MAQWHLSHYQFLHTLTQVFPPVLANLTCLTEKSCELSDVTKLSDENTHYYSRCRKTALIYMWVKGSSVCVCVCVCVPRLCWVLNQVFLFLNILWQAGTTWPLQTLSLTVSTTCSLFITCGSVDLFQDTFIEAECCQSLSVCVQTFW